MTNLARIGALACAILLAAFAPASDAAGTSEQEARAAFAQVLEAAKKKQVDQFKPLLTRSGLRELEAAEKRGAKPFEQLMRVLAARDAGQFTADMKGDQVRFVSRGSVQTATGTLDQIGTFSMIREGKVWKLSRD